MPGAAFALPPTVKVRPPAVVVAGVTVSPGRPEIEAVSAEPALSMSVAAAVIVFDSASEYCADVASPGASAATTGAPGTIVKFRSLRSKKMLPTGSIRSRVVLPLASGSRTVWLPSFGVDFSTTLGNVSPPFSDSVTRTFAAPTGAALVPATSQVSGSGCRHRRWRGAVRSAGTARPPSPA